MDVERRTPQDAGAERAVLGAILLNPRSMDQVAEEGLVIDDFAQPAHQVLFDCFSALTREGKGVDLVTVSSWLADQGKLDEVGGVPYVSGLSGSVPSLANLPHYIDVVREKALLRGLLHTTAGITEDVFASDIVAESVLDAAERRIFELREGRENKSMSRLGDVAEAVYELLRQRAESPDDVTGISTGFRDLDVLLAGLQNSDLVILAARPAMGKTAFALNLIAHASLRAATTCAFFSMEMSKEQIATRLLTSESRVSGSRVRTGKLLQDDWAPLLRATESLDKAQVFIDDTPGMTVAAIRARCRRIKAQHGLGLVAVDYLQLMRGEGREQSREQEISAISRGLKHLAKELNIPVVALSQLNRGVEQRADKRPLMSDLRESGAIEQDADVIMFLYRDEVYHPDTPDNKGMAEVLVRKQRNGSIGEVPLAWRGEFARFENLEAGFR